ncbi:MAG: Hsp20/alpha crystallin family protein [Anaerolineae bacterium]|nr:Hsp20/alpha crystallin family protein [Anaerolineae bacterium]
MGMQPYSGGWPSRQTVQRMRRAMNRRVADETQGAGLAAPATCPAMNVWANDEGVVVAAELPGCSPDNIDITVVGDTLTVKGSRTEEELPEGAVYHRCERACGSLSRAFTLPFGVEASGVDATFEQGVLLITLPRAEADKPRRITVKRQ